MANLIEKFKTNWKNKSLFGKITDILFYLLIISLLIPQSRIEVMGFVNGIRAKIVKPSVKNTENAQTLSVDETDWLLTDLNGKPSNLKDYEGKIIFINLWATWCPPCVGEMPGIQKLYDKYKSDNRVVFLMITDESPEKAKEFISESNYTFPVYSAASASPEKLKTQSIPKTFLISPEGKILINQTGAADWGGNKMEKLINEMLQKI